MTNQEVIDKVNLWQNAGFVHPLTCGKNSSHMNLVPEERGDKVVLTCPNCDYLQDWIPDYVLTTYVEVVQAESNKMSSNQNCTHQCDCNNQGTNNFRSPESCCLRCPMCHLNVKRSLVPEHQMKCHSDTETTWRLFGYQV